MVRYIIKLIFIYIFSSSLTLVLAQYLFDKTVELRLLFSEAAPAVSVAGDEEVPPAQQENPLAEHGISENVQVSTNSRKKEDFYLYNCSPT